MSALVFFESITQWLIIGLIIMVGQIVYTALGFGAGLVSISLIALIYGRIELIVPFFLLLCLPPEIRAVMERERTGVIPSVRWVLVGLLPTLILGSVLLESGSSEGLLLTLGALVVLFSIYHLGFEARLRLPPLGSGWALGAGLVSGLFASLYGMGGPPLIVFFKSLDLDKTRFRASLLQVFFATALIRFVLYTIVGLYSLKVIVSAVVSFPFALLGQAIGHAAHDRVPEALFKRATSVVLLVSGVLLIIKSL